MKFPFDVVKDGFCPLIRIGKKRKYKFFTSIEISAMILQKLKFFAETFLFNGNRESLQAVITVPA